MSRLRIALIIAALSGLALPEVQARPLRPAEPEPDPEPKVEPAPERKPDPEPKVEPAPDPEPELGGVFTVPVVAALDGVTPVVVVRRRRTVEAVLVEAPPGAQKGKRYTRAKRKALRARGKL